MKREYRGGEGLRLAILISVQRADESATSMPRATDKTESGARKEKVVINVAVLFCRGYSTSTL